MHLMILCLALILLLSVCACAGDVYQIRPLSERELMSTYTSMMLDACRQANGDWHEWSVDSKGGYWGNGVSDGNEGIRAIGHMVLTSGALLKYSDVPKGAERKEFMRKATAAIRYAVLTHVTGTQKCVDGKQWGGGAHSGWQSAMWTADLAFGAWLIWDDLDSEIRQGLERLVAHETDRFLDIKIPSGRWADTKAEENGWDLTCIAIAANMFPSNPHAAAWSEKARQYMMNTLSVAQDKKDSTMVDGKPVSEWVCTENLHPDFTLENHNIFHPSYVQCSSYFLTESAMYYVYAGRPVPQAATHHLMDVWHMFETILLPTGETAYPQGQDWELHGLNPINLFASLGTYMKDPMAARMEKTNVQYMRAWQEWCKGSLAPPGSTLGFCRHAIQGAQATWGYLAHKVFGPAPEAGPGTEVPAQLQGLPELVRHYSLIDVVLHRTASKFVSFSWKNRIMGVLVPIGDGHEGKPFFTVPITNGFVGTTELTAGNDQKPVVLEDTWKKTATGFETSGALQTHGGALKQAIKVNSVGENTVVYQDRVSAASGVSLVRERGVPFGIENDQISGGTRVVYHQGGHTVFDWQKPQQTVTLPGSWVNVDGRLGVVVAAGSGLAYDQATKYNPQGVYADVLYGSFSATAKQFKAGDEVAHRVVVFFAEVSPEETAALSQSVKIDGGVLRLTLPEGGEGEVSLL
jgi:hypothetical protein